MPVCISKKSENQLVDYNIQYWICGNSVIQLLTDKLLKHQELGSFAVLLALNVLNTFKKQYSTMPSLPSNPALDIKLINNQMML